MRYSMRRLPCLASRAAIAPCWAEYSKRCGVKHVHVAVAGAVIAGLRQVKSLLRRLEQGFLRMAPLGEGARQHEGVGHFTKSRLDRLFILDQRNVALGRGDRQAGAQASSLEMGTFSCGEEIPEMALLHKSARAAVERGRRVN